MKKRFNVILSIILSVLCLTIGNTRVFADSGVTLSPMNVRITLTPGETYEGSFTISNPAKNDEQYNYKTSVSPFFVDDKYDVYFGASENYGQIADWITIKESTGAIEPNDTLKVHYTINVPSDAPGGGQYAAIHVGSVPSGATSDGGVNLEVTYGVAYIIYAEVLGSINRSGEIVSADVPSFLFSGNLIANSSIKNTGNVHGTAKYTMQIFPVFSNEEVYTNEEAASTMTILPGRTYYHEDTWQDTPAIGLFNVIYTVEFDGATQQIKKLVIICPIWLLFIIIFVIVALIIWIVIRIRSRKKA